MLGVKEFEGGKGGALALELGVGRVWRKLGQVFWVREGAGFLWVNGKPPSLHTSKPPIRLQTTKLLRLWVKTRYPKWTLVHGTKH